MTLRCCSLVTGVFGQANSVEDYKDAVICLPDFRSARRSFKPTFFR